MKANNVLNVLSVVAMVGLMAGSANAIVIDVGVGDAHAVGDVAPPISAQGGYGQVDRDVAMVNELITVALNTTVKKTFSGNGSESYYQRSGKTFASLPVATAVGSDFGDSGLNPYLFSGDSAYLTLASQYTYLVAAYDGGNSGVEVWNISDLTVGTSIYFPLYAHLTGYSTEKPKTDGQLPLVDGGNINTFRLTGWSLLNPVSTPDGGLTAGLLGMALAAMGIIGRKLK